MGTPLQDVHTAVYSQSESAEQHLWNLPLCSAVLCAPNKDIQEGASPLPLSSFTTACGFRWKGQLSAVFSFLPSQCEFFILFVFSNFFHYLFSFSTYLLYRTLVLVEEGFFVYVRALFVMIQDFRPVRLATGLFHSVVDTPAAFSVWETPTTLLNAKSVRVSNADPRKTGRLDLSSYQCTMPQLQRSSSLPPSASTALAASSATNKTLKKKKYTTFLHFLVWRGISPCKTHCWETFCPSDCRSPVPPNQYRKETPFRGACHQSNYRLLLAPSNTLQHCERHRATICALVPASHHTSERGDDTTITVILQQPPSYQMVLTQMLCEGCQNSTLFQIPSYRGSHYF